MLPPRTRLDPEGFYTVLGLDPAANPAAIRAAFRRKAREVHPDIPGTGDAGAFVAVKRAYDVLSNGKRRESYDQAARQAAANGPSLYASGHGPQARYAAQPHRPATNLDGRSAYRTIRGYLRRPDLSRWRDLPASVISLWVALGAFLGFCVFEAGLHLRGPPPVVNAGIRPNAAPVTPLSPSAQRAELYGPDPVQLAGTPDFYINPAVGATVLWRKDARLDEYVPFGQLPPFSAVQAVRPYHQGGLTEVLINGSVTGFIDSRRLIRGGADTARRAYCEYNAGSAPYDGELLSERGQGSGTIRLENRTLQPAAVKLRDASGAVALSVFLGPGGRADLWDIPEGDFRAEFAIGEFWSRACNTFAAGMRARRLDGSVSTRRNLRPVILSDQAAASDITDQDFGRE
jgi:hypothetical protein